VEKKREKGSLIKEKVDEVRRRDIFNFQLPSPLLLIGNTFSTPVTAVSIALADASD
jgi:hypothetical protein